MAINVLPFEGAGVYNLTQLQQPNFGNEGVNNSLSEGAATFSFARRPAIVRASYDGEHVAAMGQVIPNTTRVNGLSLLSVQRREGQYVTDRAIEMGVDLDNSQKDKTEFTLTADTNTIAINSLETKIEIFDARTSDGAIRSLRPGTGDASYEVDGFGNYFAVNEKGTVMAVSHDEVVSIIQRKDSCNGTRIRLSISLDEHPKSVSWSLKYARGTIQNNNNAIIAECNGCYGRDPRYTRVVVVEEFCVLSDHAGCVELMFETDGESSSDVDFLALTDGAKFGEHNGDGKTIIPVPGECVP